MKGALRELHLFAGAGGGILGGMLLGHTTVCAVEIEPYCRKVLLQRQRDGILPRFPIWDDVRTFDGKPWRGKVDVVCGGFPCQDISVCGKGNGITGKQSSLWNDMWRIICEIRPKFAFIENSAALTIRGGATVISDLAQVGYNVKWGVFSGYQVGGPIQRERMFMLCKDARANKKFRVNTKSNLLDKNAEKKQLWGSETFATLLDNAKSQVPIVTGDERVVDGVANRVERFSAIGNGQIPAVAVLAWETLTEQMELAL